MAGLGGPADLDTLADRVGRNIGRLMFAARWVMMPIYLGLLAALVVLVVKFIQTFLAILPGFWALSFKDTILDVLSLVDLSLVANLVVIVMFAGWQNFIGRLLAGSGRTQQDWFASLDFSAVKLKLFASVTAICAIQILETFVHLQQVDQRVVVGQLVILLGIAVCGVLLALMDRLGGGHE